ncbi:FKBP-type peptidyl-prolyl cis-trans isomerase N-terminal domain-containing protein [Enterobacter ludwigii]|uniref:FKBP-type peptidyl-prolyl cis-trans isomerase N-terminal domain-containing protein n=1 Tax=Enterobacter ludwigii TaxID=299767 RepID=UPI0013D04638|nr:FKBP-type peptidyl-prolyl cis-trans isomerase N-terminal domain-containing protein [Enterobacter ludwigii]
MKWTRYVPLTFMFVVTSVLAGAEKEAADAQALQSLSDFLVSETDVPALLGVVPVATGPGAGANGGEKPVPAQVERHRSAMDVDKRQLLARLKAQQSRTQQLTATITSLNALLKTRVTQTELNAQKHASEESQEQVRTLQAQLSAAVAAQKMQQSSGAELSAALDKVQTDLKASQEATTSLREQLEVLRKENGQLMTTVRTQTDMLESTQKALADQKKPVIPVTQDEVRDYAVGTSLGSDVLLLLKERATMGVNVSPEMALAGIRDVFAGKLALTRDVIEGALEASANSLARQGEKERKVHEHAGRQYMTAFAAKAGVVKDPGGFLYHVDYPGEGAISESDMVSVVVKEMLTDGTVIKDMESSGKWVSQPVNAFPPVFRDVILKLKNHGSATLVVPPELAYGGQGYPPKVPPGATMVYSLRIRDVSGH